MKILSKAFEEYYLKVPEVIKHASNVVIPLQILNAEQLPAMASLKGTQIDNYSYKAKRNQCN